MLLTIRMALSVGVGNRAGSRAAGSASGLAMALSGCAHPRWSGPGVSPGMAMKRVRGAAASSVQDRVQARRLFVSARRGAKEAEGKSRTETEAKVEPGARYGFNALPAFPHVRGAGEGFGFMVWSQRLTDAVRRRSNKPPHRRCARCFPPWARRRSAKTSTPSPTY